MRKIIVTILLFFCFKGNAQVNWTNIFGKQRFAQGFGIPVVDTSLLKGANDTACLVLMRGDSNLYYRYKGHYRKLSVGGGGAGSQDLQSVLDNGSVCYTGQSIDLRDTTDGHDYETFLSPLYVYTYDGSNAVEWDASHIVFTENYGIDSGFLSTQIYRSRNSYNNIVFLPNNKQNKTDTLATLSDVRAGGGGGTIDTTNKWVNSVTSVNDSTFNVVKGTTSTNITIKTVSKAINATRLITSVYNNSGTTIAKGSVVYINGRHSSNLPTIALAQANTEANSYSTFALVMDDIPTSNSGTVIQAGTITNLNLPTSSFSDGQIVYLSPTVAGGLTITKPLAPYHIVKIGTITRAHPTYGTIELKIENGWQLDEMSDVQIAAVPNDSTILQFSRVDSLWHAVNPTTAMGNRFVKTSDSAAMLTAYHRKADSVTYQTKYRSDTARTNIYSGISSKLNISDTATMLTAYHRKADSVTYQTKYRSDTARTNIYSGISSKLNISDTATMLTAYHRKADSVTYQTKYGVDTARTNIYSGISSKLNISDTSTFQRKSLTSYSFSANNTNATANATAQTFKDTTGVYSGTITWTGTTAPSGTTSHTFNYTQVGKMVTLSIFLVYATVGASLTEVVMAIPATFPQPKDPTGLTGNSFFQYPANTYFIGNTGTALGAAASRSMIRKNSGGTGYEIDAQYTSGAFRYVMMTTTYYTN